MQNIDIKPDIKISIKQTFGIDSDLEVDAFSKKNDLENLTSIFKKKNTFKGKIGIFDIENNKINHKLNFYEINDGKIKEIF